MSIPAELEALTCLNPDDLNDYLEKILARLVSASEDPVVLEYQPLAASSDAAADLHALS
ncbi:hypothetical protein [Rhodoligotrophos defluvii]|uniref:hypothetical protein n=1 Tax=Rhodoligotrophos defluvii TaxID=2561934 RepID=UPI001960D599|nr:hypothetical protein [Rhodoligotrophos defluvii]